MATDRSDGFADRVELANAAYGQAEVLTTPLQLALVAATIANGGLMMQPTLVDRLVDQDGAEMRTEPRALGRVVSAGTADTLRDAMVQAVEGPDAAGYAGGAKVPGVHTAGKSGTAQLAPGETPHSWFVGFAPAQQPRIAIVVVVENAGAGSEHAVPLGGRLMSAWLKRFAADSRPLTGRGLDRGQPARRQVVAARRTIRCRCVMPDGPGQVMRANPYPHEDLACPRSRSRPSGSPRTSSG